MFKCVSRMHNKKRTETAPLITQVGKRQAISSSQKAGSCRECIVVILKGTQQNHAFPSADSTKLYIGQYFSSAVSFSYRHYRTLQWIMASWSGNKANRLHFRVSQNKNMERGFYSTECFSLYGR